MPNMCSYLSYSSHFKPNISWYTNIQWITVTSNIFKSNNYNSNVPLMAEQTQLIYQLHTIHIHKYSFLNYISLLTIWNLLFDSFPEISADLSASFCSGLANPNCSCRDFTSASLQTTTQKKNVNRYHIITYIKTTTKKQSILKILRSALLTKATN